MMKFLIKYVAKSNDEGIIAANNILRDARSRKNMNTETNPMTPSKKRLRGRNVAESVERINAKEISCADSEENALSEYAKATRRRIAAERSGLGEEMYCHGSVIARARMRGVAKTMSTSPGRNLFDCTSRTHLENSMSSNTNMKPFTSL